MMEITSAKAFRAVLPYQSSDAEKYAFEQLSKYLKKTACVFLQKCNEFMPQAECEIIIGNTVRSENFNEKFSLTADGYYIVCRDEKLYLGGQGRGVIYAVFAFLERFAGCRFYAPDEEEVPYVSKITLPEDFAFYESPIFTMRDVLWSTNFDIDWSVKQKVNRGHYRNYFGGTGGEAEFAGYFGHTLGELAETGYDAPEPCLTDEGVYRTVLKNVRERLRSNPNACFVSVSQNDDFRVCTCEKCAEIDAREESHAGTMIAFVNRIAAELEGEYPNVRVHTFAYQYTRKPPKYIRPRHNVVVQLCPIECCARHSVADCKVATPAPWAEIQSDCSFYEDFLGWAKISPALQIWDYTTNFHHYFAPFPNLYAFLNNIRFYAQNGVTGLLMQGNVNTCRSGEFAELKAYLLAKLLWNPMMSDQEYEMQIDEFLLHFYGDGWQYIRQYIDALHELCCERHFGIYAHPLQILPVKEGLPFMIKAKELFQAAENRAKTALQKQRITCSAVQVDYYLQLARYECDYRNGDDESRLDYIAANKELYQKIIQNGIYMNPDKPLPQEVDFTQSPDLWHKLG